MAQTKKSIPEKTRVLIILDCSNSMWEKWQSDSKIKVTQQVLLHFLDSIQNQPDMEVALRVFGHLNRESYGSRLEVPFEADNHYKLQSKIKTLVPNGGCTADSALNNALKDFPHDEKSRNIILVITDGLDDCQGSVCEVARQVQQSGSISQSFIIGIGNPDDFQHKLDCAGRFTFVPNEEFFAETLHEVFYLSDQKSLVTLALTDSKHNLYETDVPVIFYDHLTHAVKVSTIYHYTIGQPADTLVLDPLIHYDITIFTTPPIHLTDRHFKPGQHNRLEIPAPLGTLRLHLEDKRTSFQLPTYSILVHRHGESELLASQPMDASRRYLEGGYDLEILSQPIIRLANIQIRDGSITDLQLPLPGQLALDKPSTPSAGSIFSVKPEGLQWVCNLDSSTPNERIVLMSGDYQIILQPLNDLSQSAVRSAHFSIRSAKQTSIAIK